MRKILFNYIQNVVKKYQAWKQRRFVKSVLNDAQPVFQSFGNNVYMSDIVNNCIDRIATEISKLSVKSVVDNGEVVKIQNDDLTRLFRFQPNPLQTTKDFLASLVWLQRKDMHAFVYPQYEIVKDAAGRSFRRYTALWPLKPARIEMGMDGAEKIWLIRFYWDDGSYDTLPYSEVIHMKWRRGKNVIVGGGDDYGNADTRDSLKAVQNLDKAMQGIPLTIEASMKLNGVFTAKTKVDAEAIKKARDEFEYRIQTSKFGIAAIDIAGDFQPVTTKPSEIPEGTMKFLKDIIRERYGVSDAIISGDYGDEQHSAFYETCLEDFIEEFQQAFSSVLFTPREQDVGHRIKCYYKKVEYFSTANKIQLATIARDTGLMTINQMAEMFGIEPFEGGDRRLQSLNYVNTELVDSYQLQGKGDMQNGQDQSQEQDANA